MEKTRTMPVSKLSYSSLTQLLRNPLIFKLKEILGVYDSRMGISGMVGRACHVALKTYYGGNGDIPIGPDVENACWIARDAGLEYLDTFADEGIDYGKTGDRETMLKNYNKAMDIYFSEEPAYNEILLCEEKLEGPMKTDDGQELPLPGVGIPDLVHKRKDGGIEIIDHKFVKSFTDPEQEDHTKIIQAMFMYHLVKSTQDIQADRMLFREVKYSVNKDGGPQIQDYAIPLDHEPYKIMFYNLYRDVVNFLSNDPIFLPNISDMFDGEQAGLIYREGLISGDMSDVEVMHKVKDVAFTSKKFVGSRLDSALNENLLPEEKIKIRLSEFGIPVEPVDTVVGSSITQYRFKVSAGIRMASLKKHKDDIARALETDSEVKIIAPIPGTSLVGVEVENKAREAVKLSAKHLNKGTLMLPIGVDVQGVTTSLPLNEMPHLLIAGSTGSGKSVLLHSILNALTKQMTPDQMELLLIDPKRVELSAFNKKPHLREKVIYEYEEGVRALMNLTEEMESRYELLEKAGKRDINEYNNSRKKENTKLKYIVAVFDEFADFMIRSDIEQTKKKKRAYSSRSYPWLLGELQSRKIEVEPTQKVTKAMAVEMLEAEDAKDAINSAEADVEQLIVRLAQMARAVGIHLIIATQRPSVDVVTGLIKANFPTRIALTTSSPTDSTVILGQTGAEKLAGKGDMLLMSPSVKGLRRLQGFQS